MISTGDEIKYTNDILSLDSSMSKFRDKKLTVLAVKLKALMSKYASYDIYFKCEGSMYKEIGVNEDGCKLVDDRFIEVFEPWDSEAVSQKVTSNEDDRCTCGVMGEVKGMACICPNCGSVVWGA